LAHRIHAAHPERFFFRTVGERRPGGTGELRLNWKLLLLHPFNGPFCRTAFVSQYQKGKTSPDFNEARDDGVWDAVTSAGPYANNLHLAAER